MATKLISDSGEASDEYSYHSGLDMALSKALCDDLADFHGIGQ